MVLEVLVFVGGARSGGFGVFVAFFIFEYSTLCCDKHACWTNCVADSS